MIHLPIKNRKEFYQLRPSKIIALGLNYRDHIAEFDRSGMLAPGTTEPTEPVIFAITPNAIIGHGDAIVLPEFIKNSGFEKPETHYEAELAIVMGARCSRVSPDDAMLYVLGYTCANDVSQRDIQRGDVSGWYRGKSLDTFCPVGPCLVPAEELDPSNLAIEARLNGRTVQKSNTSHMIFELADVISYISRQITLEAGDLIITGTPSGVGPIKAGDVVEIEIEGVGILRNPVTDEVEQS